MAEKICNLIKSDGEGWKTDAALTITGAGTVSLTGIDYSELIVKTKGNTVRTYSFYLIKDMLPSSGEEDYTYGWGDNPARLNYSIIEANKGYIKNAYFYDGGTNYTSTSTMTIYYR